MVLSVTMVLYIFSVNSFPSYKEELVFVRCKINTRLGILFFFGDIPGFIHHPINREWLVLRNILQS